MRTDYMQEPELNIIEYLIIKSALKMLPLWIKDK